MSLFLYRKAAGTLLFGSKIEFLFKNKEHIWDFQVFGTFSIWLKQTLEADYAACFLRVGKAYSPEMNVIYPEA